MDNGKAMVPVDQNVFLTFDRLDDDQIIAEMKGAALDAYVYEFGEGGKTVRGLSKAGTDDASRIMAVNYGEALREVDVWLEFQDEEAGYFKAKVSRFKVLPDGTAIEMDSAIGQKRQSKRVGNKPNNFWYEQGGQKALRNAKQKLMPEPIKQAIIQSYIEGGKVRKVKVDDIQPPSQRTVEPDSEPKPATQAMLDRWGILFAEAQAMGMQDLPVIKANISAEALTFEGRKLKVRMDERKAELEAQQAEQEAML